jgi:hypothetical protein
MNEHAFPERGVGLDKGAFKLAGDIGALGTAGTLFQVAGADFLLLSPLTNWFKGTGLPFSGDSNVERIKEKCFFGTNSYSCQVGRG